jgi:hypothetical protein
MGSPALNIFYLCRYNTEADNPGKSHIDNIARAKQAKL